MTFTKAYLQSQQIFLQKLINILKKILLGVFDVAVG